MFCLYEDVYGAIWAGSGYEAISRLKGNQVTHYPDTGFLKDNNCETFSRLRMENCLPVPKMA
ncbi:MAG: hypothetical protein IPP73_14920 [Chitinophagaceae bacterium]|nr:hypothetical protein [Chitinophagaceae bacterium]